MGLRWSKPFNLTLVLLRLLWNEIFMETNTDISNQDIKIIIWATELRKRSLIECQKHYRKFSSFAHRLFGNVFRKTLSSDIVQSPKCLPNIDTTNYQIHPNYIITSIYITNKYRNINIVNEPNPINHRLSMRYHRLPQAAICRIQPDCINRRHERFHIGSDLFRIPPASSIYYRQ